MDARTVRPSHYVIQLPKVRAGCSDGTVVEVVDLIDALDLDFNRGNALKYLLRAGRKEDDGANALTDWRKVLTYAGFVVAGIEGESPRAGEPGAPVDASGDPLAQVEEALKHCVGLWPTDKVLALALANVKLARGQ